MILDKISEFIAISHKNDLNLDPELQQKLDNFIDIIKSRIQHNNIESVADSLHSLSFELRSAFIQSESLTKAALSELSEKMKEKAKKFADKDSKVSYTLAAYSSNYGSIFKEIFKKFDLEQLISNARAQPISFDSFMMYYFHPEPRVKYIKNWINASIQFEIGFVVANLFLMGELNISSSRMEKEILPFIKQELIRFGAYAIFIHYWAPDKDWIRNSSIGNTIKLLAASLEHEYYPTESGTTYDVDDFQQLIDVA